jgi:hypothetical protein
MKTLKQIREASGGKEAYQKFFNGLLKKFGVSSPSELDGKKKKDFFDAIDKGWEGAGEKAENVKEGKKMVVTAIDKKTNSPAWKAYKDGDKRYVFKEARSKLKGGKGKVDIDINFDGDAKDIKFASTKYKIKFKTHSNGAVITGDKQKILAYLQGQDYAMDDEDIEDLYPEVLESSSDFESDEDETDDKGNYSGVDELEDHVVKKLNTQPVTELYARGEKDTDAEKVRKNYYWEANSAQLKKAQVIASKNSGDMEAAIAEIEKIKKGLSDDKKVMAMLKKANESVQEANRFSKKLKGAAKDLFDLSWKAGGKSKAYGDKEWDAAVDKMAAKYRDDNHARMSDKDIAAVKLAIKHESVQAEQVGVDGRLMGFKASTRRAMGEKQKGKVIIDRRTREAKATAMRLEKAKAKREEKKKAREFAEKYPKIDYNYAEASELNKIIAKSNTDIMGETAANAVSAGGIDMAPNKGSKKKKKLMAKRGY